MFFKVVACLALFAVVSAQRFGNIAVQTQDGDTIVINQNTQQQVRIDTNPLSAWGAQKTIKIQVTGPAISPKTVHIADQPVDFTGTQQSDILNQILSAFNGRLTEGSFQQLLTAITQQVAIGQLNPIVLHALQTASNNQQIIQSGVQKLIQNMNNLNEGTLQGQWQQGLVNPEITGLQRTKEFEQFLIRQGLGGASNELVKLASQEAAEELIQNKMGQNRGIFQGTMQQARINKQIASLQRVQQNQQLKQALINQALNGGGNTLTEQAAEQLIQNEFSQNQGIFQGVREQGRINQQIAAVQRAEQNQQLKEALINQAIGRADNSLSDMAAEQALIQNLVNQQQGGFQGQWQQGRINQQIALQKAQRRQALISQTLSGRNIKTALEAGQAAQALRAVDPQNEILINQIIRGSRNPLASAQSDLEAEETAQILAAIGNGNQFRVGDISPFTGRSRAGQTSISAATSQIYGRGFGTRGPSRGGRARILSMSEIEKQAGMPITEF